MTEAAFQANAFQNDAFQIGDVWGLVGSGSWATTTATEWGDVGASSGEWA